MAITPGIFQVLASGWDFSQVALLLSPLYVLALCVFATAFFLRAKTPLSAAYVLVAALIGAIIVACSNVLLIPFGAASAAVIGCVVTQFVREAREKRER